MGAGGAKGQYQKWLEPEGLTLLTGWARQGLTDEQIAHNIGIARQTLYTWKNKCSDIADALKKGKEVVDLEVENKLYQRAIGYDYTEITKERRKNPYTDRYEMVVTKRVTKHIPADVTAQIYWTKNRMYDRWRDKVNSEISGNVGINLVVDDEVSADEQP